MSQAKGMNVHYSKYLRQLQIYRRYIKIVHRGVIRELGRCERLFTMDSVNIEQACIGIYFMQKMQESGHLHDWLQTFTVHAKNHLYSSINLLSFLNQ